MQTVQHLVLSVMYHLTYCWQIAQMKQMPLNVCLFSFLQAQQFAQL